MAMGSRTKVVLQSSYEAHGTLCDSPRCRIFQGQLEVPHPQIPRENVPVRIALVLLQPGKDMPDPSVSLTICFPNQKDYFGFPPNHRSFGNLAFQMDFMTTASTPLVSKNFVINAGDGTCLKYFANNKKHQTCSSATYIDDTFFSDVSLEGLRQFTEQCIQLKNMIGGQFFYIEVLVSVVPIQIAVPVVVPQNLDSDILMTDDNQNLIDFPTLKQEGMAISNCRVFRPRFVGRENFDECNIAKMEISPPEDNSA